MFTKAVTLAAFFVAVSGQAAQYPAGIDPRLCPNYPDCADPAVAARSIAGSLGFPSTQFEPMTQYFGSATPTQYSGQYIPTQYSSGIPTQYSPRFESTVPATPPAATHPAGVDPRVCPNYPLCDNELLSRFL